MSADWFGAFRLQALRLQFPSGFDGGIGTSRPQAVTPAGFAGGVVRAAQDTDKGLITLAGWPPYGRTIRSASISLSDVRERTVRHEVLARTHAAPIVKMNHIMSAGRFGRHAGPPGKLD